MKFLLTTAAIAAIAFGVPALAEVAGSQDPGVQNELPAQNRAAAAGAAVPGGRAMNSKPAPNGSTQKGSVAPGVAVPGQRSAEDGAVTNPAMPHGNMDTRTNTSTGMNHTRANSVGRNSTTTNSRSDEAPTPGR